MNEQLKDAVITIAGYDKGWTDIEMPITDVFTYTDTDGVKMSCRALHIPYHQSADAILNVYRKLRSVDKKIPNISHMEYHAKLNQVGAAILNGNYESACIELANIINQIKEKV